MYLSIYLSIYIYIYSIFYGDYTVSTIEIQSLASQHGRSASAGGSFRVSRASRVSFDPGLDEAKGDGLGLQG